MAYRKEPWTTNENIREEIEDLLDGEEEFLEHDGLEGWSSEREYLQYRVIPDLIDQMVDDPANEGLVQKLDYAKELIESDAIGVAIFDQEDIIDGVELRPLPKYRNGKTTLMILTRPNIIVGLESGDDRKELIIKFRNIFVKAADRQRELGMMGKFVPYSKVLKE